MGAPFIKMQGLGNDFVVFDGRSAPVDLDSASLRAIADRRTGVGCDQIIVIESADNGADARMVIRNADGSMAEACGTGACATGVAAARRGLTGRATVITLDGGDLYIDWRDDGHVLMTGPAAES